MAAKTKKEIKVEISEEEQAFIDELLKNDKNHKPGDAIPIFKLLRMMSLHDPRWGKPKEAPVMEKTVSTIAREIAPPET